MEHFAPGYFCVIPDIFVFVQKYLMCVIRKVFYLVFCKTARYDIPGIQLRTEGLKFCHMVVYLNSIHSNDIVMTGCEKSRLPPGALGVGLEHYFFSI